MSKIDPAGELAKLLDASIQKKLLAMNVAFPCRVLSFNETSGNAKVQPLIQTSDAEPAPILNVPALGQRLRTNEGQLFTLLPAITSGDIVYVVCSDRKIAGSVNGSFSRPDTSRNHDRNDAVIVGVFPCSLQS